MVAADDTRTCLERLQPASAPTHLLVVSSGSSRRVALPASGLLVVGRGADADLRVEDESVSRRHAEFATGQREVTVADLGSHNGTRVNGERLSSLRKLATGDVVQLGEVALIVCGAIAARPSREILDGERLRRRLDDELERAAACGREVGLVLLGGEPLHDEAARAVEEELRPIDLIAELGSSIALLVPESDRAIVVGLAERVLAALARGGHAARAGVAIFPDDGGDAGALLAGARAALELAEPGKLVEAAAAVTTVPGAVPGDRATLVADAATLRILALTRKLARSELAVLLRGETGSGKEHAARALHQLGPRAASPFVALNSAAVQDTLIESELFGYEKGAFSGATSAKPGLLEAARGGTVFFDEVGELSPLMQAKLLRALDTKRITRVGSLVEREIDIRIVAATNRDLEADVAAGRFRQDLFFRLDGATITLPPLRERPREIALLLRLFLGEARIAAGRGALRVSPGAMRALSRYSWPGNVRELRNFAEYAGATLEEEELLEVWHLPPRMAGSPDGDPPEAASTRAEPPPNFRPISEELRELERRRMREALEATGGAIKSAASLIGMPLRTFHLKARQYALGVRRLVEAGEE